MKKKMTKNPSHYMSSRAKRDMGKRILITLGIFFLYALGSNLSIPGVNTELTDIIFHQSSVFAVMNMIGGGALQHMSLFALGVTPYITASIIVELLSMDVIPTLSEWRKGGRKERDKITNVTRAVGLILAIVQAGGIVYGFDKRYGVLENPSVAGYVFVIMMMVAGTELLCWLGDQITSNGIGNGLSMIIFAGIVSGLPSQFTEAFNTLTSGASTAFLGGVKFALYCLIYLLLILAVVIVENSERHVPISYSTRTTAYGGNQMSFLPLKINSASVIPVIFASSVMTAPLIVISFFSTDTYQKASAALGFSKPLGLILYAVLTFIFTFFYTDLQVDPGKIAEDLKSSKAFIPGIRPGNDTYTYLNKVLRRITLFGASGLTILAVIPYLLPMLITSLPSTMGIGGTSVILIVGIALETIKMIETASTSDKYKYSTFTAQSTDNWYKSRIG